MAEAKARAGAGGTDSGGAATDTKPAKSLLQSELEAAGHRPIAAKLAKQDAFNARMTARREGEDQTEVTRAELDEQAKHAFTAAEMRKAQTVEYGTYVAADAIESPDGNARAFNPGDPVPVSTVEKFGWHEEDPPLVRRVDGKG